MISGNVFSSNKKGNEIRVRFGIMFPYIALPLSARRHKDDFVDLDQSERNIASACMSLKSGMFTSFIMHLLV